MALTTFVLFGGLVSFSSCSKTDLTEPTITSLAKVNKDHRKSRIAAKCVDIDGNEYRTIRIGNQVWMAENLRVTRYRNGQPIANVTSTADWANLAEQADKGAWCFYGNNANNESIYGKLYNWYAATDSRNIAPQGWHVPTNEEWIQLGEYLRGYETAAGKLKATGTTQWAAPNTGATNSSGFTALPAGERLADGTFGGLKLRTHYWSTNNYGGDPFAQYSLAVSLFNNQQYFHNSADGNFNGRNALTAMSVRCVRDN